MFDLLCWTEGGPGPTLHLRKIATQAKWPKLWENQCYGKASGVACWKRSLSNEILGNEVEVPIISEEGRIWRKKL